jgi:hypothetical protein
MSAEMPKASKSSRENGHYRTRPTSDAVILHLAAARFPISGLEVSFFDSNGRRALLKKDAQKGRQSFMWSPDCRQVFLG